MTTATPAGVFVRIACAPCLMLVKQRRKNIPDLARSAGRRPVQPCRDAKKHRQWKSGKSRIFLHQINSSLHFCRIKEGRTPKLRNEIISPRHYDPAVFIHLEEGK
jgi:hypothetical protein